MVHDNLVYNIKLSSVGPARLTGSDVVRDYNGLDLAVKLHYLKGVYFFSSDACVGLTIKHFKESFFYWCNDYYMTSGRFRRSEAGRPYMKCNDCGVRFVEAMCDMTVDEWLEMKDCSLNKLLVYHLPLGPDLFFSPPLYVQVTKFKCGGLSLGLSWAHILGDIFSASDAMVIWAQFLSGLKTNGPLKFTKQPSTLTTGFENPPMEPLSVKRVDPVGDHWVTANNSKMETFSFYLTASQVSHIHSNMWGNNQMVQVPFFESLCAIIWQCIAKIREGVEPKIVTLCKRDPNHPKTEVLSNVNQIISYVTTNVSVLNLNLREITQLLVDHVVDESSQIEALVEKDNGISDYIVYGTNLTFMDLEKVDLYGMEWNGHKPKFAYFTLQGVGDDGVVMVLPWPKNSAMNGIQGRMVTVILPEDEVGKLKFELKKNGLMHNENELD